MLVLYTVEVFHTDASVISFARDELSLWHTCNYLYPLLSLAAVIDGAGAYKLTHFP